MGSNIGGHFWTISPTFRGLLSPPKCPASQPWSTEIPEAKWEGLEMHGFFSDADSDTAVVILHGLGGNADGIYMRQAAQAASDAGFASLRMSMRGAVNGEDLYHGGLTTDLRAALASAELERFSTVYVIGHSMGGHMALKAASEGLPDRVKGVVAIGSPLDLALGSAGLDEPKRWFYREYVLRELRASYERLAELGRHSTPVDRIRQVRSLQEYDALTIVPRFGFADLQDYYATASVAAHLNDIEIPSLLIASNFDPMIPRKVVEPATRNATGNFSVVWVDDGGHVYFPPTLDLGFGPQLGAAGQALEWLKQT